MANDTLAAILADIKNNSGRYYVYILSYPDGVPFYIGCSQAGGRHPRILDHEKLAISSNRYRRSMKSSIIRKIIRGGGEIIKSIDSWHLSSDAMFDREINLIATIGRRDQNNGTLANGNDGGTGQLNPSPRARAAASSVLKAWWTSDRKEAARETARIKFGSEAARKKQKAACASPEFKARQSLSTKAALAHPEKGPRIRNAANAVFRTAEYRASRSGMAKAQFASADARSNASKKQKEVWSDPAYRAVAIENCREMGRKYWATPEARKKASIASSRPWSPSVREKCSERQRASWTPERRAANSERMKKMRATQEAARRTAGDK